VKISLFFFLEKMSLDQSDIWGQGHGSNHNWKRLRTVQAKYEYIDGERTRITVPFDKKCTFYQCRKCQVTFKHYYDLNFDIFNAMEASDVSFDCDVDKEKEKQQNKQKKKEQEQEQKEEKEKSKEKEKKEKEKEKEKISDFGVCDSPEQFAKKYPEFQGPLYLTPVYRNKQPRYEGWRWHKWGPYVGVFNISKMEYLHEANGLNGNPQIDIQWLFSLTQCDNIYGLEP
jgi:hypothetical protein